MKSWRFDIEALFLEALEDDDAEAVKKLLDRGMEPDDCFFSGSALKPAICLCAKMERTGLVEVLLQAGGNVDQADEYGRTSLHDAAASGNVKMLAILLSKGAEVNCAQSILGHTPLHLAADGLNSEIVRLLIDAGADVNIRNATKMTPLLYACTLPSLTMGNFYLRRGAEETWDTFCHRMLNDVSFFSELLKAKSCVKSRDENGCTVLHHIVRGTFHGVNTEALELLLSYPCDVDAKNRLGHTPLYVAATLDNRKAVLLLLKAGCRVDIGARPENIQTYTVKWKRGPVYLTPVDIAVLHRFYDVAELLVAAGARIKREVWMNKREAIEDEDPSTLERMLAAGAECPKLLNACRRTFYDHHGTETPRLIDKLDVPPMIMDYLTFEMV